MRSTAQVVLVEGPPTPTALIDVLVRRGDGAAGGHPRLPDRRDRRARRCGRSRPTRRSTWPRAGRARMARRRRVRRHDRGPGAGRGRRRRPRARRRRSGRDRSESGARRPALRARSTSRASTSPACRPPSAWRWSAGSASFEEFWEASFEAPALRPRARSATPCSRGPRSCASSGRAPIDRGAGCLHGAAGAAGDRRGRRARGRPWRWSSGAAHARGLRRGRRRSRRSTRRCPRPSPPADADPVQLPAPRRAARLRRRQPGAALLPARPRRGRRLSPRDARGRWSSSRSTCACAASRRRSPTRSRRTGSRRCSPTIRGKAEPGLDEVREATIATLCRGDATHVDGFLWPASIGHAVGRVARRIGRNSLQDEFWREVHDAAAAAHRRAGARDPAPQQPGRGRHVGLPAPAAGRRDRLRQPRGRTDRRRAPRRRPAARQRCHACARPGRRNGRPPPRPRWWRRSSSAITLEDVASDALDRRLAEATSSGVAATVAARGRRRAAARAPPGRRSTPCERLAADGRRSAVARQGGPRAVAGSWRTARRGRTRASATPPSRRSWPRSTYVRSSACDDAATGTDEAVEPAPEALRTLHEMALTQPGVDRAAWIAAARGLMESYVVNAGRVGPRDRAPLPRARGRRRGGGAGGRPAAVEPRSSRSRRRRSWQGFLEVNATGAREEPGRRRGARRLPRRRCRWSASARRCRCCGGRSRCSGRASAGTSRENVIALRGIGAGEAARRSSARATRRSSRQMSDELSKAMDDLGRPALMADPGGLDARRPRRAAALAARAWPGGRDARRRRSGSARSATPRGRSASSRAISTELDDALAFVYGEGDRRSGGGPYIPRWLAALRGSSATRRVALVQKDAIERKGVTQLLFEPETLPLPREERGARRRC